MKRAGLRIRAICWLPIVAATVAVGASGDRAFRRIEIPTEVEVRRDVPYRESGGHRLVLDVYQPPGAAKGTGRPAILLIHGGSWVGGSRRLFRPSLWDPRPMAVRMAEDGFVVVVADYRVARPGIPAWPAARDDLREAVRWIRRNAGELGVDPGRIGAIGLSAGGHLAEILGTEEPNRAEDRGARDGAGVSVVVAFYGPSDLERLPSERVRPLEHEPVRAFLAGNEGVDAGVARDASPVHRVGPETVPMLLIHGTLDPWVPIEQSERMAGALRAAGVDHRLIRVEGARHGFELEVKDPEVRNPGHRDLWPEILAFLHGVWNVPTG